MLTVCLLLVAGVSLALTLLSHGVVQWLVTQRFNSRRSSIPVSILKPLKGIDDDLETNLESFCRQTHPQYEIILGAADPSDPALPIARKVARAHPEIPIRVVVGECPTGLNPKVRLLRALLRSARYDAVLISDSNVHVEQHYLSATAAELEDPVVGLVSNPIVGVGDTTLGSALESLQLNTYLLFGLALANFVGRFACVVGKSMLLRRSALRQVGGFGKFADVLAEDYLIGRAIRRSGWRVVTCPSAINTINRTWSMGKLWQRHLRWAQIRKNLGAGGYILELLLLPHVWLLAAALSASVCDTSALKCSGQALVVTCIAAYVAYSLSEIASILRWSGQKPLRVTTVLFVALRQFGQFLVWIIAWTKSDVTWRGNRLRIGKGSKLTVAHRSTRPLPRSLERQVA